ncbi:MAG: hypothetical protein J6X50_00625 [Bacilli bacterium]|nr:hypothetical protein [Bacilli bacterium]
MSPKSLTDEKINILVQKMLVKKEKTLRRTIKIKFCEQTFCAAKYKTIIELKKYSLATRRKVIKQFLIATFKKNTILTSDGVKIGVTDNSASKLSRLTYNFQQEIALFSDELLKVATFITKTNSYKKKKGEFRYYISYIFLERKIYGVVLNVFTDANGSRLYDINKISQITASGIIHGSSGNNNILINNVSDVK